LIDHEVTTAEADGAARAAAIVVDGKSTDGAPPIETALLPSEWRFESRFVEVKGPSDRLSERQRVWLVVLLAAGADCRICRVLEPPTRNQAENEL
jgi:hypothetical protein